MLLHRHDFGSVTAIGIENDDPIEIERKYYSFYNHQATSGELHWLTSNFAYFWTNNEDLNKALLNIALFELLNIDYGKSKGKKRGLLPEAQIRAEQILQSIQITNFIVKDAEMDLYPYKFGYIEFETPDLSSLPA
jgi:hypothetical protein